MVVKVNYYPGSPATLRPSLYGFPFPIAGQSKKVTVLCGSLKRSLPVGCPEDITFVRKSDFQTVRGDFEERFIMKPKILLRLALVLTGGLLGCSTTARHSIADQQWGPATNGLQMSIAVLMTGQRDRSGV